MEDPTSWTSDVVLHRDNWDLSFDKWEFASEIAPDRISFVRVETEGLVGYTLRVPFDSLLTLSESGQDPENHSPGPRQATRLVEQILKAA